MVPALCQLIFLAGEITTVFHCTTCQFDGKRVLVVRHGEVPPLETWESKSRSMSQRCPNFGWFHPGKFWIWHLLRFSLDFCWLRIFPRTFWISESSKKLPSDFFFLTQTRQGFHQLKGYTPKEGALAISDEDFCIQKRCKSQRTIWDSGIFQMFWS